MKKSIKQKILLMSILVLLMPVFGTLLAETTDESVIQMENKAGKTSTKNNETFTGDCRKCHMEYIVTFPHKKHIEEYNVGCGECHHDEKGQPLARLKVGDDVKRCIECHKKPGVQPKKEGTQKTAGKEKLMYHAEAMHENCKGCHKAYNEGSGFNKKDHGTAPADCTRCHPNTFR